MWERVLFRLMGLGFLIVSYCGGVYGVYGVELKWGGGLKVGYGGVGALVENDGGGSGGILSKGSLSGGLFFNFSHVDFIKIQIEVLYIQKGVERGGYGVEIKGLTFPILLRGDFSFGLFLNSGVGVTYLMEGGVRGMEGNFGDNFETLEYDWVMGIGWVLEVEEGVGLMIEMRFSYTINNISLRYQQEYRHYTIHPYISIEF